MSLSPNTPQISFLLNAENRSTYLRDLRRLVHCIESVLTRLEVSFEVVVIVDEHMANKEQPTARRCRLVSVRKADWKNYGSALRHGFKAARGQYIVTMDADLTHNPWFLQQMWAARETADIIIGSRYVPGGRSQVPLHRHLFSQTLNRALSSLLALPVQDISSNFRWYNRDVLDDIGGDLQAESYDILEEILVRGYIAGWRIREVPIHYQPRSIAQSNRRSKQAAQALLMSSKMIWRLRNRATACDYDARAFHSRVWPQRYWQRRRFSLITSMMRENGLWLDIACGSSQIIRSHPAMIGFDLNLSKLRYLRTTNPRLVNGTMFQLPFKDAAFDGVICSEVIEHIPKDPILFEEMRRVLKPGGTLILGTPDYDSVLWNIIEGIYSRVMPSSYADEHISHYTLAELKKLLEQYRFQPIGFGSIVNSEVIYAARKMGP